MKRNKLQKLSRPTTALVLALAAAAAMTIAGQSSAATLYVSQTSASPSPMYATPDTAAHTIQQAVDAASDGDTVLVAPGQYGLTNQIIITKAITLQSTMGAGQTFLNGLTNIWCLAISNSLAIADGFTIPITSWFFNSAGVFLVGGTVQNCNFTNFPVDRVGAAVFMTGGVLSNSIVTYHRVASEASAVYCSGGGLITDCQILPDGRRGAGGVGVYLVGSQLRDSFILGAPGVPEMGEGAAVFAVSSAIEGCAITHNFNTGPGGGAWLDTCLMDRCVVAYNVCAFPGVENEGGGGVSETNSIIRNSLIVSNRVIQGQPDFPHGGLGGGIYMRGGALVNCTVSENAANTNPQQPGHGAGVYVESGGITNSIISSNFLYAFVNLPDEWFNAGAGVFDHSCTTPDPGGIGNIIQDPQFLDLTNGNYHLASSSPCIAAGEVQPWMTNAFDLDGNPRTTNGVVDIGAYQSPFATAPPPPPPTPQQRAEALISEVNNLANQGTLNRNQEKTLNTRLKIAVDSMNEGRTATACSQVAAFINQVQAHLKRGTLTQAQAQSLTDAADKLRVSLGCQ